MLEILHTIALSSIKAPNTLPQVRDTSHSIPDFLKLVFGVVGALALLMITISGLRYITSAGDAQKAAKARTGLVNSLVGLAIAISAEAIVAFVVNRL